MNFRIPACYAYKILLGRPDFAPSKLSQPCEGAAFPTTVVPASRHAAVPLKMLSSTWCYVRPPKALIEAFSELAQYRQFGLARQPEDLKVWFDWRASWNRKMPRREEAGNGVLYWPSLNKVTTQLWRKIWSHIPIISTGSFIACIIDLLSSGDRTMSSHRGCFGGSDGVGVYQLIVAGSMKP